MAVEENEEMDRRTAASDEPEISLLSDEATGEVIAAQPGYYLLELGVSDRFRVFKNPIIGWWFDRSGRTWPVTLWGKLRAIKHEVEMYEVLTPDGRVITFRDDDGDPMVEYPITTFTIDDWLNNNGVPEGMDGSNMEVGLPAASGIAVEVSSQT